MRAEILAVGTELLLGDILNTNARFLARELAGAGVEVYHQVVVGDNAGRLREQLEASLSRSELVICTGGLGPTYDDLTKETAAALFDCPLLEDGAIVREMEAYFHRLGREMTPNNRKQALVPKGAQVLPNPNGTAPGIWMERDGRGIVLLPGPPREMEPMFRDYVLPELRRRTGRVLCSSSIHIYGLGESYVEAQLRERMLAATNPTIAPYAKEGEMLLRLTAMAESEGEAQALIAPVRAELVAQFGEAVYGVDTGSLERALVEALAGGGLHLATAESCTGGLISQRITAVPGSSAVFDCGVCTYANTMKEKLLGVSGETLGQVGAVSEEVALQMARGVRRLSGAEIGISTTGIAGPGGGSEEKPVGLVYIGVSCDGFEEVIRAHYPSRGENPRESIRSRAASQALYLALRSVKHLTISR